MDDAPTLFGLAVIAAYIAHEVVLVWLIFDRRQVFERRTFRLYLGSQVVMAILALAAFWSLIIHSADLFSPWARSRSGSTSRAKSCWVRRGVRR